MSTVAKVQVEKLVLKCDARGSVCEPLNDVELGQQKNTHLVITLPGGVRGNHYHRRSTEIFAAYGPALIRIREGDAVQDYHVPAGEAWRFTVPPGVPHAVQTLGNRPGLLLAFSTQVHDPQNPDLVREELIRIS